VARAATVFSSTNKKKQYEIGDMNGKVYPVNGGMEDFSYGVWEGSPIITFGCDPPTYGGYPAIKSTYTVSKDIIKSVMFLLETSNSKTPNKEFLGRENLDCLINLRHNAFFNKLAHEHHRCLDDFIDGYIPRIIRIALTMIDIVRPYINSRFTTDPNTVTIEWAIGGAITVDSTYITYNYYDELPSKEGFEKSIQDSAQESEIKLLLPFTTEAKIGKAVWSDEYHERDWLKESVKKENKKYLVYVPVAKVDQNFGHQSNPDPKVPPQSHLSNGRINPNYKIKNGEFELNGRNFFVGDVKYVELK
jgi:hypothetical protein